MTVFLNAPKNPLAAFAAAGFSNLILVRNGRAVSLTKIPCFIEKSG
jgi:hypothetical protein